MGRLRRFSRDFLINVLLRQYLALVRPRFSGAQYLLNVRVQRAEELLAHTTKSIVDIAHATGFGSHSHFTRSFRERRGMTPTVWRAQQRAAPTENAHTDNATPPSEPAG